MRQIGQPFFSCRLFRERYGIVSALSVVAIVVVTLLVLGCCSSFPIDKMKVSVGIPPASQSPAAISDSYFLRVDFSSPVGLLEKSKQGMFQFRAYVENENGSKMKMEKSYEFGQVYLEGLNFPQGSDATARKTHGQEVEDAVSYHYSAYVFEKLKHHSTYDGPPDFDLTTESNYNVRCLIYIMGKPFPKEKSTDMYVSRAEVMRAANEYLLCAPSSSLQTSSSDKPRQKDIEIRFMGYRNPPNQEFIQSTQKDPVFVLTVNYKLIDIKLGQVIDGLQILAFKRQYEFVLQNGISNRVDRSVITVRFNGIDKEVPMCKARLWPARSEGSTSEGVSGP